MSSVSSAVARISARVEATLSTNAFTMLFLTVYITAVFMFGLWGYCDQFSASKEKPYRVYISIARAAGYTLNLNTALVILLASRLFLTFLRDSALSNVLPLDKAFPAIHIAVAVAILAGVIVHVPFHFVWILWGKEWRPGVWQVTMTVATGGALLLVFSVLLVFTLPAIRRKHFRAFYLVHLVGAFMFFVLLILHGMYNASPETYKYVTAPLMIYAIDRIIRMSRSSTLDVEVSKKNTCFKDAAVLQLSVAKPFEFQAGQYAGR